MWAYSCSCTSVSSENFSFLLASSACKPRLCGCHSRIESYWFINTYIITSTGLCRLWLTGQNSQVASQSSGGTVVGTVSCGGVTGLSPSPLFILFSIWAHLYHLYMHTWLKELGVSHRVKGCYYLGVFPKTPPSTEWQEGRLNSPKSQAVLGQWPAVSASGVTWPDPCASPSLDGLFSAYGDTYHVHGYRGYNFTTSFLEDIFQSITGWQPFTQDGLNYSSDSLNELGPACRLHLLHNWTMRQSMHHRCCQLHWKGDTEHRFSQILPPAFCCSYLLLPWLGIVSVHLHVMCVYEIKLSVSSKNSDSWKQTSKIWI